MHLSRRQFLAYSSLALAATAMPALVSRKPVFAANDPFVALDGVAQAALIRNGDASAMDVLEAAIARIDATNPSLNAVVTKLYDRARDTASAGTLSGPFAGVPTLIKDLDDVAGARSTYGCRAMMGYVPDKTDEYVQACIDAGLNVVGKSNTPEYGLAATTESLALGPCYNVWDRTRSGGGSSGGAGVAVGAGMVPIGQGSDGGGSIRIPACCNGVVGLKTSRGRLIGSSNAFGLGVHGGITRSVRDSAQLLASTERTTPAPGMEPVGLVERPGKKRLTIGMSLPGNSGAMPSKDVQTAIASTVALCEELGHTVVDSPLQYDGKKLIDNFLVLWASAAGELSATLSKELGRDVTLQEIEPLTMAFAEEFFGGGRAKLGGAARDIQTMSAEVSEQIKAVDVVLTPVLSHVPPVIGEQSPTVPYDILIQRMIDYVDYTTFQNATGMPAISLPLYWTDDNLPIGSHFTAPVGGERVLLELAYELEEARPWFEKWAPHSAVKI